MQPTIRWIAALLLPALVLTGALVGAPKKLDKELEKTTDKMVKVGTVVGKVVNVYEDKKMFRVSVGIQKLNPAAYQQIAAAQRSMAMARTPQAYQSAQYALAQAQRTMYTTENKEIELKAAEDVVVRMARPKEEFDEKGKPKKYTKKEKAEMRGTDRKLPGYKAEFGDLSTDQIIQVTLVRKKGMPAVARYPRRGKKNKDEGAEADLMADYAPMASMIVILREPAPPPK